MTTSYAASTEWTQRLDIGVGLGLHANNDSKNDVQQGNPALDVRDDVGLSSGVFGIFGVAQASA